MKKLFAFAITLTLSATSLFAAQQQPGSIAEKKSEKAKVQYTCPMDKDVITDKPGKCPKCGMTLVKKEVKAPAKMKDSMNHMR